MNLGRGTAGYMAASRYIGHRVAWPDLGCCGTIVDVTTTSNGYPRWVVAWDAGAPRWLGDVVAPGCGVVVGDAA